MYIGINDIRRKFLNFFKKKGHQIIESSSLIPNCDHTLLFTNAGMNQFKDIFLGKKVPSCKRVTTVQRCMRAGGKHNDLDRVGYTSHHLTFFEMLGNFSFGDYFKYDAIKFAWELLTDVNWFNLSPDKLWVTVHQLDQESYDIWHKNIGISNTHIVRIGNDSKNFCVSDNFWQMGPVGPCGPCSEIFYDRGDFFKGDPPSNFRDYGDRYIEIWNLVFIQFNRQPVGHLLELPVFSVDTGMGLERIASILQGKNNNYSIDVFKNLIDAISEILLINKNIIKNRSLHVIADHIRACVFLIQDGVIPDSEGRGYVLRRIIRRSICHGKKLGIKNFFLYKLVNPVIKYMSYITDISHDQKNHIKDTILHEEKLFENTLKKGLRLLEKSLDQLQGNILDGGIVFRLYDTYGFPLELTRDICYDHNVIIDQIGFDQHMKIQKKCSKKSRGNDVYYDGLWDNNISSVFVGYTHLSYESKIIALFYNNNLVYEMRENQEGIVILDNTPFYGESGGQIGDSGDLITVSGNCFTVTNTKKYKKTISHLGKVYHGVMKVGEQVISKVDTSKRKNISLNHSATHLLRVALFKILGPHVVQKGSFIHDKYFRFDFVHYEPMTEIQIVDVETFVNKQIWNNLFIQSNITSMETAKNQGAVMLLDKQYDDEVRVLSIGDLSVELCSGTHVTHTGEIGLFFVRREHGVSSGIRRIEAVTGNTALLAIQKQKKIFQNIMQSIACNEKNVLSKICELKYYFKKMKKSSKINQLINN